MLGDSQKAKICTCNRIKISAKKITDKHRKWLSIIIYLFINYNTITNYMLIIYVLCVVQLTRTSGVNRTHDPPTSTLPTSTLLRF